MISTKNSNKFSTIAGTGVQGTIIIITLVTITLVTSPFYLYFSPVLRFFISTNFLCNPLQECLIFHHLIHHSLPFHSLPHTGSNGDGGPAIHAQLFTPSGIAVDTSGNLYVADTYNYKIRQFNYLPSITSQPTSSPTKIAINRCLLLPPFVSTTNP